MVFVWVVVDFVWCEGWVLCGWWWNFIWVVVDFLWVVMATEQWWQFFPSSRSGFYVGGNGLCLSLVVVVAGLGLHFLKKEMIYPQHFYNKF